MQLSVREYRVEGDVKGGVVAAAGAGVDRGSSGGSSSSSSDSSSISDNNGSSCRSRTSGGVEVRVWLLGSGNNLIVSNLEAPPTVVEARPLSAPGPGLGSAPVDQDQDYRVEATLTSHDALPREQEHATGQGLGPAPGQGLGPAPGQGPVRLRNKASWAFATIVNTKIITPPSDSAEEDRGTADDEEGATETSSPSNLECEDDHKRNRQPSVGRDTSDQGVELVLRFPFP